MIVRLSWPNKLLWPNGPRSNRHAVARIKKAARHEASWAAIEARQKYGIPVAVDGLLPVHIVVMAKPYGPLPDRDNCIAACKAYLDGIAEQIGVNDRDFAAPTVQFITPRCGEIEIHLGVFE